MLVSNNERYLYKAYKRKENSPYEWEETPFALFKGRPANQMEKRQFRIQQGVNGNTDSVYILVTNLPEGLQIKDKVEFLGKEWTVVSIGYYFDSSRFVNPSLMTDEYIASKCPKGINLQ